MLNIFAMRLLKERAQHGGNADISPIWRKTSACQFQCPSCHAVQCLVTQAIGEVPLGFSEANNASWPCDPHTLLHQIRPCRWWHESKNEAGINQVKCIIRKVEGLEYVYDSKTGIFQTLYPRLRF